MRRFFCENCGDEVQESDDLCPHCGAVFTAIKCPRCGYRGKLHQFYRGCPRCGFLGENKVRTTFAADAADGAGTYNAGEHSRHSRNSLWSRLFQRPRQERPPWLFWLILLLMTVAFVLLSVVYMHLP